MNASQLHSILVEMRKPSDRDAAGLVDILKTSIEEVLNEITMEFPARAVAAYIDDEWNWWSGLVIEFSEGKFRHDDDIKAKINNSVNLINKYYVNHDEDEGIDSAKLSSAIKEFSHLIAKYAGYELHDIVSAYESKELVFLFGRALSFSKEDILKAFQSFSHVENSLPLQVEFLKLYTILEPLLTVGMKTSAGVFEVVDEDIMNSDEFLRTFNGPSQINPSIIPEQRSGVFAWQLRDIIGGSDYCLLALVFSLPANEIRIVRPTGWIRYSGASIAKVASQQTIVDLSEVEFELRKLATLMSEAFQEHTGK